MIICFPVGICVGCWTSKETALVYLTKCFTSLGANVTYTRIKVACHFTFIHIFDRRFFLFVCLSLKWLALELEIFMPVHFYSFIRNFGSCSMDDVVLVLGFKINTVHLSRSLSAPHPSSGRFHLYSQAKGPASIENWIRVFNPSAV